MANSATTVFLSGKIFWCKLLGNPVPNYNRDGNEWTVEFEPDEEGVKILKQQKLADRLKDKYEDRGAFLTLKQSELRRDGSENEKVRVYNADDEKWDYDQLIGNGSSGDVKLRIVDYGVGKKKGVYITALRVTDHVPYQSNEFGGMAKSEGAEAKPAKKAAKKDTFREDFGLDDDISDIGVHGNRNGE